MDKQAQQEIRESIQLLDEAIENLRDAAHGVGYALAGVEATRLIPTPWINNLVTESFPEYYTTIRPNIMKLLKE